VIKFGSGVRYPGDIEDASVIEFRMGLKFGVVKAVIRLKDIDSVPHHNF